MKKIISFILILAFIISFGGCSDNNSESKQTSNAIDSDSEIISNVESESESLVSSIVSESENAELTYKQISAEEAKHMMDTECNYFIIDARTDEEFAEGHIEGAILIPEYEIDQKAEEKIPDKNALILVYCRSGRRSKIASDALVQLGYTNVYEFGGIIDWPYEIVR